MVTNLDDLQKVGKENVDAGLKFFGAATKSAQAIAAEVADYSKKSFEEGSQALEKLAGAKSLEGAFEIQQLYLKNTYEGFMAQANKLGTIYADLAKETYKPFETFAAKTAAK